MKSPGGPHPTPWMELVAKHQTPDSRLSIGQVCTSFIPFIALCVSMYFSLESSYWLTLALALPAAGFLARIFIIQHDCGHGSFFRSKRSNDYLGFWCGVLTLTPYKYWRLSHSIHHSSAGNLDKRGIGDIYTLTVTEYLALSRWKRLAYRIYRHPMVLFGVGSFFNFVVLQRFGFAKSLRREQASLHWTNLAIGGLAASLIPVIGIKALVLVYSPIMFIASAAGTWLFYVQHQFEQTYWTKDAEWDYTRAALVGSSYYKLPSVLRWFSGNIGFHHIHHLSPRIPNYRLRRCHEENRELQQVTILTLASSVRTASLGLWDEATQRLVGFQGIRSRSDPPTLPCRGSRRHLLPGVLLPVGLLLLLSAPHAATGSGWMALPHAPPGGDFQDVFFVNPELGWVVNGAGEIQRTTDGGDSWDLQVDEPTYLRTVGFVDSLKGWVGNLNGTPLLYATTNGGTLWTPVLDIPEPRPTGICGIWVVNASVAYACGKYDATSARVIKTTDGGASWTAMDLAPLASSLIDCHFFDEDNGFVVGGVGGSSGTRRAVVLATTNGGVTWTTRHITDRLGEWCWKISFPTPSVGYVSIERFSGATYFLKTTDGGQTWQDLLFRNYIVQGIGFATATLGWIGGSTGPTYESTDGGASWNLAGFGVHINRFRFLGWTLGYAVGQTVYKYTSGTGVADAAPESPPEIVLVQNHPNPFNSSTSIAYTLARASDVKLTIVSAQGREVLTLLDGRRSQGTHELHWDARDGGGNAVSAGVYWYRLETDLGAEAKRLLVIK